MPERQQRRPRTNDLEAILRPFIQPLVNPREAIVVTLRTAIAAGALKPDAHIRQQALADVFQVSRMPVREALRILAAEGRVDCDDHRGCFVNSPKPIPDTGSLDLLLGQLCQHYRQLQNDSERQTFRARVELALVEPAACGHEASF
ncbi:GntR family transcriptional regulator [Pseudomonas sp. Marseille-Q5115]|uniref:GntR family transcriptional regulator n=1 Tax=Pseudomonas sp. Marseille-Q5115 TaxID=2866593 RepID=UPI001CE42823|nr:GntR family transcriptional regulator [Pseudomonas sp. Marseille-Q5115]